MSYLHIFITSRRSNRCQNTRLGIDIPPTNSWVHLNGSLISLDLVAIDETKLAPYPHRPPPKYSNSTLKFGVQMTGVASWALNVGPHEAFRQQLPPLLWEDGSRGLTTYGSSSHALRNGSVVDIIFQNGANVTSQHPFHKHNHKAWIIGMGKGGFPWSSVEEAITAGQGSHFNFENPPIRDGCRLGNEEGDWTVIRYEIFFPAASMLHCHMIHHFAVSFVLSGRAEHVPVLTINIGRAAGCPS